MQNLLSANLFHLCRHKAFWAAALFMVVYALAEAVGLYRQGDSVVGDGLFAFLSFFGVVLAAFCTLYLGTEYHDGTIRNKVAAGFRRGQIYGAYLLACLFGGVILWAVYVVVYLAVGLPLLGGELGSPVQLGTSLLGCLLITAVWVSLYTCLVNLIQAKSTVTAAAILLAFAMLLGSMFLYSRLDEPQVYTYTDRGFVAGETNPNYLQGAQRTVYEALFDILPDGQGLQILAQSVEVPKELGIHAGMAAGLVVLTTGLGAAGFQRKNLK